MAQSGDERSWVEQARAGDPEAVGLIYERYFDRIYKYIYLKLGDPNDAEDLAEQVFLKMIEGIPGFQWQGSTFASWLYRIAHNQVIDFVRQRTRRPQTPIEPLGDLLHTEEDEPHSRAEQSDFADHLGAAIRSLTDLQANVIMLRFGAGLTNAQVAESLGRTEGAVKALQYSALQNLNKKLRGQGWGEE